MKQRFWHKRGSREQTRTASTTGWTQATDPYRSGTTARPAWCDSPRGRDRCCRATCAEIPASSNCPEQSPASPPRRRTRTGCGTSCTAALESCWNRKASSEPLSASGGRSHKRPVEALSGRESAV